MKKIETKFLNEAHSNNDRDNGQRGIMEEKEIIIQQQTGPDNEETEDIFETYYNNRFD